MAEATEKRVAVWCDRAGFVVLNGRTLANWDAQVRLVPTAILYTRPSTDPVEDTVRGTEVGFRSIGRKDWIVVEADCEEVAEKIEQAMDKRRHLLRGKRPE